MRPLDIDLDGLWQKLRRQLSEPLFEEAPNTVDVWDVLRKQVDIPFLVKALVPVSDNWYGAINPVEAFLLATSGLEKPVIAGQQVK